MIIRRKPIGIENLRKPNTLGMNLQRNAVQRMLARQVQRYVPGEVTDEAVDFQETDSAPDDGYQDAVEDAIRRAEAADPNAPQAAPRRVSRTPNWNAAPLNQPAAPVRRTAQPQSSAPAAPKTPSDAPASASPFTTRQSLDQGDTMPGDLVAIMNLHKRLQAEGNDPIMQPMKTDPRLAVQRTPAKAPPVRGEAIPQSKTEILGKSSTEPIPPADDAEPPRIRRRALITDLTPPKKGLPFGDEADASSQPLGEPVQRDMAQALYAPPTPRESRPAASTQGRDDVQADDTEPSGNDSFFAALENYQSSDDPVQRTYEDAVEEAIRRAEGPPDNGDTADASVSQRSGTSAQPSNAAVQPTRADRSTANPAQSRSAGAQPGRIQRVPDAGDDDDLAEFADDLPDTSATAIQRTPNTADYSGGDDDLTQYAENLPGATAIQRVPGTSDLSGDDDLAEFTDDLPDTSATAIQRTPDSMNYSRGNDTPDVAGDFQDADAASIQRDYGARESSAGKWSSAPETGIVPSGYADAESYTSALNSAIRAAEAPDASSTAVESTPPSVSRRAADSQPRPAVQRTSASTQATDPRPAVRRSPPSAQNDNGRVAPDHSDYQNTAASSTDESNTFIDTASEAPSDSLASPAQAARPLARSTTIRRTPAAIQDEDSSVNEAATPAAFDASTATFEPQTQAGYSTPTEYSPNTPAQEVPFVQRAPSDDIADERSAVEAPSGYADSDQYNDAVTAAIRAAEAPSALDNTTAQTRAPRQVQRTSRRDAPAQDTVSEPFDAEAFTPAASPEQAASGVEQDAVESAAPRNERVQRTPSRNTPDVEQPANAPDTRASNPTAANASEPSVRGTTNAPRQAIQRTPQGYTSAEDYQAAIEQAASQAEAAPVSNDVADMIVEQPRRRSAGNPRNMVQLLRAEVPTIREPDTNPVMPPDSEPDRPPLYPPIDPPQPDISDPPYPGVEDPSLPGISDPPQPGISDPILPGISDPTGPVMPGTAGATQAAVQRYPEAYADEDSYQAAVNDAIRAAEAPSTMDTPPQGSNPRSRSGQNPAAGRDAPRSTSTARISTVQPTRNPARQQAADASPETPAARPNRVQRAMQNLSRRFADAPDSDAHTADFADDAGSDAPVQRYADTEYSAETELGDDGANGTSESYNAEVPSGYASPDSYQDAVNAAIQSAEAPPDRPARRTPGVQRTSRGVAQTPSSAQDGSRGIFLSGEMSDSAPSLEEDALNSAGDSLPLNAVDLASALGMTTGVQRTLSDKRESSAPSETEAGLLQLLNLPPDTRIARPRGTYTSPEAANPASRSASQSSSGPAAQSASGSIQRSLSDAPVESNDNSGEAGEQEPSSESVETMAQAVFKILKKKLRTEQDRSKGGR